jgi:uncharacterized protein (DUF302 family)
MTEALGFEIHLATPYEEALDKVTESLKKEGFGILTHIDVKATLKEKLGEDFRPYSILGACNPPLAHQALAHDANVGLLLPCNVTVEAVSDGGTLVRIGNPDVILDAGTLSDDPVLQSVAAEARKKLETVAQTLQRTG